MKRIITTIILLLSTGFVFSQNYERVLRDIEQNNTTLKALRAQADAQKMESRKDIHLDNPEVEFGYLWGSPTETGKRLDLNVSQSFDFPTTYYYKKKIADGQAAQADLTYESERRTLMAEARKLCIEMIYLNIMREEDNLHIRVAEEIQGAYQKMFDEGEVSILDLNKAKLSLLAARKEFETNQIERERTLAELTTLNGGQTVVLEDTLYPAMALPSSFDEWYRSVEQTHPALQQLALQQELNRRELQLSKSLWAPKFTVGYNSERILGTTLQGVGVGIQLPLWQNRYAVKSAQAQSIALERTTYDLQTKFRSELRSQYDQALGLQALLANYHDILHSVNTTSLLRKALDSGSMTLVEYLMEISLYYEARHEAFETERDLQAAIATLKANAE